ncbi:hypothetical protein TSAR_012898 [Trichomalopsis sarcophagae]|uniref:Saposin B-type domain-containing protein n=1 Tax=Trichomalopsis sarcophagae TaxID=543379 RepID=A0A232EQJ9_9HYME|nr:hypothetical protein TSAR_012898 [Trichomalopsis sarcophagae]
MMKIALFLAVGLVAVFNSPVNAELTEEDGQKLLDAIKDEVAKQSLQCAGVESYCSHDVPNEIPATLCPNLLKAYLCDNVNSAAGINQVLVDIAKRAAKN